jgi:hypothetical protein
MCNVTYVHMPRENAARMITGRFNTLIRHVHVSAMPVHAPATATGLRFAPGVIGSVNLNAHVHVGVTSALPDLDERSVLFLFNRNVDLVSMLSHG